jgi:hypothetical protein
MINKLKIFQLLFLATYYPLMFQSLFSLLTKVNFTLRKSKLHFFNMALYNIVSIYLSTEALNLLKHYKAPEFKRLTLGGA